MKYLIYILPFISLNACATTTNCHEKTTQSEMTHCSIQKLNLLENKLSKSIANISKTLENDKKFSLANDTWSTYLNAHCQSVSNIYSGGSIHRFVLSECKAKEIQKRINSLENDYIDTINIITKGAP